MNDYKLIEAGSGAKDYSMKIFHEDVKKGLMHSGMDSKPVGFILSDIKMIDD